MDWRPWVIHLLYLWQQAAVNTLWVKKVHHRLFAITSPYVERSSKFFHWHTLQKICNKVIIKDAARPETLRYTTLWNKNFQHLHRLQSRNGKFFFHALIEENVAMVDNLALCPKDQHEFTVQERFWSKTFFFAQEWRSVSRCRHVKIGLHWFDINQSQSRNQWNLS